MLYDSSALEERRALAESVEPEARYQYGSLLCRWRPELIFARASKTPTSLLPSAEAVGAAGPSESAEAEELSAADGAMEALGVEGGEGAVGMAEVVKVAGMAPTADVSEAAKGITPGGKVVEKKPSGSAVSGSAVSAVEFCGVAPARGRVVAIESQAQRSSVASQMSDAKGASGGGAGVGGAGVGGADRPSSASIDQIARRSLKLLLDGLLSASNFVVPPPWDDGAEPLKQLKYLARARTSRVAEGAGCAEHVLSEDDAVKLELLHVLKEGLRQRYNSERSAERKRKSAETCTPVPIVKSPRAS